MSGQQKDPSSSAQIVESEQTVEAVLDERPGERLKIARESLELSVSDVAERLKLNAHKIEALERGDVADVATPVFVAGYLRSYARLLGLSEETVLADFSVLADMELSAAGSVPAADLSLSPLSQDFGKVSTTLPVQASAGETTTSPTLMLAGLIGLVLIVVTYLVLSGDESVENVSGVTLAIVEKSVMEKVPMTDVESDLLSVEDEPTENVTTIVPLVSSTTESDLDTGAVDDTVTEAIAQSELALFFLSDSWVEVNDALGERLVYRLGKAGMARTVMGVPPFDVQLGYAPGVDIMYNGVPYDLSRFAGRRSARFKVGNAGDQMASE